MLVPVMTPRVPASAYPGTQTCELQPDLGKRPEMGTFACLGAHYLGQCLNA